MRLFSLLAIGSIAVMTASCQKSSPQLIAADRYLTALKDGNTALVDRMTCLQGDGNKTVAVQNPDSWEFKELVPRTSETDSLGSYVDVQTEVEYVGVTSQVKDLFVLTVWETEKLYESNLRLAERLNQSSIRARELIERVETMMGEEPSQDSAEDSTPLSIPRSDLTDEEYCITQFWKPDESF